MATKQVFVRDGVVVSVEGNTPAAGSEGQWITSPSAPHPKPGWTWDGAVFAAPVYTRIRTEAFWERFTNAELIDYDVAMQHNPADTNNAKKAAAKLRVFQRDADAAGYRDLTKPKVRTFVTGLEGGVLVVGRATIILDTPITKSEAY